MQQTTDLSLLSPLGYQATDCGYCKEKDSSERTPQSRASYYVRSKSLSVDTYQALIDRGWRRSGSLLYKPDVFRACCPHYTIRLPAASLKTSRDQRQTINRWNRYVLGDKYESEVTKQYPKTREAKAKEKNGFDLVQSVHAAELRYLKPVEPAHRFEVTLEKDDYTDEKFELYKDYQSHVHHDKPEDITKQGFKRFLCTSPLKQQVRRKSGMSQPMGAHHQCYRLDGKLIAMGVLDLLPHAVSGVYFLYHSDYEKWSFGKLSALREAALAIENGYEYYYMGFYIHNCVKMRYKGDYKPQYVLDPLSYEWHALDGEMLSMLDQQKFVSLTGAHSSVKGTEHMDTPSESSENTFQGPDGEQWQHKTAKSAMESGESLFTIRMPGVLNADQVSERIDLDDINVSLGMPRNFKTKDLVSWDKDTDITSGHSLKGIVAELAACVGPEICKTMAVDFSR